MTERYVKESDYKALEQKFEEARAKLFPYADAAEISGISHTGVYLIGDRASIKEYQRVKNIADQVDIWRRCFDEHVEFLKQKIDNLEDQVIELRIALDEEKAFSSLLSKVVKQKGQK